MNFNIYKSYKAKTTDKLMTQTELLELIRNGGDNRSLINTIREYNKGDEQYTNIKSILPVVSWNVHFNDKKTTDYITSVSGYMYLDKDGLTDDEITHYKEFLMTYPYVIAVWKSVGGRGFGCLMQVDNITKDNFKNAWNEINKEVGIDFDLGASKLTQLNVISYDPDIRVNETVVPYSFTSNTSVSGNTSNYSYTSNNTSYKSTVNSTVTNNVDYTENTPYNSKVHDTLNHTTEYIYRYNTPSENEVGQPIIFKTKFEDSVFDGNQYVVFEDGTDFLSVYTRNLIPESKRHTTLSAICSVLITLNPNHNDSLFNIFNGINTRRCVPPLPYREVLDIFNYYYRLNEEGKLNVIPRTRFIIFKDNSGLSLNEKLKISGREGGKLRRSRTQRKIMDSITSLEKESPNTKITQKIVAEHAGYSLRTIKKYWSAIKV